MNNPLEKPLPYPPVPARVGTPAAGRGGFTLIEVIISIGILATIMAYTLKLHMTMIQVNRVSSMVVDATNQVRTQGEEAVAAARESELATKYGLATAVLQHYASQFKGKTIEVGGETLDAVSLSDDKKQMVYRFNLSQSELNDTDAFRSEQYREQYQAGVARRGEMVFYLAEADVPPAPADVTGSTSTLANVIWRDLGAGTGSRAVGFDINRDGEIKSTIPALINSVSDLTNAEKLAGLNIRQLPVDVTIHYYTPGSLQLLYTTSRRLILMDEDNLLSKGNSESDSL